MARASGPSYTPSAITETPSTVTSSRAASGGPHSAHHGSFVTAPQPGQRFGAIQPRIRSLHARTPPHRRARRADCVARLSLNEAEQLAHGRLIGRRETVLIELGARDPTKVVDVHALRRALDQPALV